MRKNSIRVFSLILALLMIIGLFTACGKETPAGTSTTPAASTQATDTATATATPAAEQTNSSVPKDFITLKILYPGDESKRMADFLSNEFKQKLKDELNTAVEVSWSPWDQYWNKKDMMIAAGEQIDFFWDGAPNLSKVVSSKSCVPIDDLLNQYGQDIKKVIPEDNMKSFVINGKLMGIPIQYGSTAEKFTSVLVRQDLLQSVGMSSIASVADMTKFADSLKAQKPDMKFYAANPILPLMKSLSSKNLTFDANNYIAIDEDAKKAEMKYFADGYKAACDQAYAWNQAGYIPEEVAVKPGENVTRMATGTYAAQEGAISRPMEDIGNLQKNVPDAKLIEFMLTDKPKYKTMASTEGMFISSTAKYPERAMMMINWMLKSKENYMFCIYGVEGKDYTIENNRIMLKNTDSLWYEWMFRNLNYMQFPNNVTDEFIQSYTGWDKDAKLSCHFGFAFDPTPVKNEEAMIAQVIAEQFVPMETGYVPYEGNFDKAKEALIAAGCDKYLAEYQKQLDAFVAAHQ